MSPSTELAEARKPVIVTGRAGLQLQTLDDVWRFAQCLAKSGLAPKGLQSPEAITIAVQMGMELGLPPMAAMQNIAPINGRPTVWGDAQLGIVRGTGELEVFEEWFEQGGKRLPRNPTTYTDDTVAVCRVKRAGHEETQTGFSVADAKRANLWGKAGPWTEYPFRMLRQRARGYSLRDAFGDALRGIRPTEEAMDEPQIATGRVVEEARIPSFLPAPAPQSALPPAREAESPVAQQREPEPVEAQQPAAEPPRQRRAPRQRTEEAPPLTLESTTETAVDLLSRKIREDNLDPVKVEAWFSDQLVPPLDKMMANEADAVLDRYTELQSFATRAQ